MSKLEALAREELTAGIALREQAARELPAPLVKAAELIDKRIRQKRKALGLGE